MQEPHWIRHSHGNDVRTKKIDDSGEAKFIGPSQAMKDALEAEGLHVTWPDNIYSGASATFSPSYDSEYDVTISLGWNEEAVKTNSDVDSAIAQRLYSVYRDYADHPWRYELDDRILEKWHREQKLNWSRILGLIRCQRVGREASLSVFLRCGSGCRWSSNSS